jgi:hypothetical protein
MRGLLNRYFTASILDFLFALLYGRPGGGLLIRYGLVVVSIPARLGAKGCRY